MFSALFAALFNRAVVVLVFWTITVITCAPVMYKESLFVGFAALIACAMYYSGAAGFMGLLIARREKGYSRTDLFGIGGLGLFIICSGTALVMWSGFSVRIFDVHFNGVAWALLGAASAVIVVRKEDAL